MLRLALFAADISSRSAGASIGIDLGTGLPVANGSYASGNGTGVTANQLNSHVNGTGTVALVSGHDTNLKGATVSGGTVIANVGHDLTIESLADTATYGEKSFSASASFGPSGIGGGFNKGSVDGDYTNIAEQSGILAGSGGYHVDVGNGVSLIGGIIASTAPRDKNSLSADHLAYSNIDNRSNASTSSYGLSLSLPGAGTAASNAPLGGLAVSPAIGQPASEDSAGKALATITPGSLTLAHQTQDLASLNNDLSRANIQAERFDIDELKKKQASAAALSELLNSAVGDVFPDDPVLKTIAHAAVGAIVAKAAGGNVAAGAAAGAASELANRVLQDILKDHPELNKEQQAALTQWVAVAAGAAVGGQAGAATGLDNVKYNYLNHEQLEKAQAANRQLIRCVRSGLCSPEEFAEASSEVAHYKQLSQANTRSLIATCTTNPSSPECRDQIYDLIRFTKEVDDLFSDPLNDGATPYVFAAGDIANLDQSLAKSLQSAINNHTDIKLAIEEGITSYGRKQGSLKATLDALGIASAMACTEATFGACAVLLIGAGASANHMYSDAQQVITGKEAKTALVEALIASGISLADAEKYQAYVDTGAVIVTIGEGGVRFLVNKAAAGSAAGKLASLEQKVFNADEVLNGSGKAPNNIPTGGFGPMRRSVDDPSLDAILDSNYGNVSINGARVGNGGTADALRYEIATGELLSPSGHRQKAIELRTRLQTYVRRVTNSPNPNSAGTTFTKRDIDYANELIRDLDNAIGK